MSFEKILIVEDDEFVADSLEKTLTSFGYTVAGVASSGKNAISMTETNHPDLILMDSVLKGPLDVVTTAAEILSRIDIPIIYLIPHDNEELIIRANNRLPNGFLTKPVDKQQLYAITRRALIYHAWGKIPTENMSQCYSRYEEVVCTKVQENYVSRITYENGDSQLRKSERMAY